MRTLMNAQELEEAFEEQGYHVINVRYSKLYDETSVLIRDRARLAEASEFGRKLGVIVRTPC